MRHGKIFIIIVTYFLFDFLCDSLCVGFSSSSSSFPVWSPDSWRRAKSFSQLPHYPSKKKVSQVVEKLRKCPPLVYSGEIRTLQKEIAEAGEGRRFLLTGGDCAESFDSFSIQQVMNQYRLLLQLSLILMHTMNRPVVKIGRWAGQFAKPRSSLLETQGNQTLPIYQGDLINGYEFTEKSRRPDPSRMIQAYHQSCQTLNLIRALSQGGYADLHRLQEWNLEFVESSSVIHDQYFHLAKEIQKSLQFLESCGLGNHDVLRKTQWYTGHEGLLLPFEEALTRRDSVSGNIYACSGHYLWIGERTRQLEGAHLEYFRGIQNPIGLKLSSMIDKEEFRQLISQLNPTNEKGRISLITRMGETIDEKLPQMISWVKQEGFHVTWICDPMHANTKSIQQKKGRDIKTRFLNDIRRELHLFFQIHHQEHTIPGGIHLECSGSNIYECVGQDRLLNNNLDLSLSLHTQYTTLCDPRLNAAQSLELAFWLGNEWGPKNH